MQTLVFSMSFCLFHGVDYHGLNLPRSLPAIRPRRPNFISSLDGSKDAQKDSCYQQPLGRVHSHKVVNDRYSHSYLSHSRYHFWHIPFGLPMVLRLLVEALWPWEVPTVFEPSRALPPLRHRLVRLQHRDRHIGMQLDKTCLQFQLPRFLRPKLKVISFAGREFKLRVARRSETRRQFRAILGHGRPRYRFSRRREDHLRPVITRRDIDES